MFEPLDINWVILYFVYGQVFFIMGLAIALQLRGRRSQLELARSLPWLAGFGITHGLTEWGYIFIPLQVLYFPPWIVTLSRIAHLILLAFSFFCLFQFGLQAVLPQRASRPWLGMLCWLWPCCWPPVRNRQGLPVVAADDIGDVIPGVAFRRVRNLREGIIGRLSVHHRI